MMNISEEKINDKEFIKQFQNAVVTNYCRKDPLPDQEIADSLDVPVEFVTKYTEMIDTFAEETIRKFGIHKNYYPETHGDNYKPIKMKGWEERTKACETK